jgi:hypothetical protein
VVWQDPVASSYCGAAALHCVLLSRTPWGPRLWKTPSPTLAHTEWQFQTRHCLRIALAINMSQS